MANEPDEWDRALDLLVKLEEEALKDDSPGVKPAERKIVTPSKPIKVEPEIKTDAFRIVHRAGVDYVDFTKAPDEERKALNYGVGRVFGRLYSRGTNRYPFDEIAKVYENLRTVIEEDYNIEAYEALELLFECLHERFEELREEAAKLIQERKLEFYDIPLVMVPGNKVIVRGHRWKCGGKVKRVSLQDDWQGRVYYVVVVEVVQGLQGPVAPADMPVQINIFEQWKTFDQLPVAPLDAEEEKELIKQGEKIAPLLITSSYMQYDGQLVQPSWWGEKSYRADGRIMIDGKMGHKIDQDRCRDIVNHFRLASVDNQKNEFTIQPSDYWCIFPYVIAFSFRAKNWGMIDARTVSAVNWRRDAFNLLVMEDKQKEIVRALVEHSNAGFTDIIEGKGGGIIFLLAGPPGTGKTATAETVAEALQRPLYSISVGELGVSPDQLEDRLRTILDVATAWDAVILLDEADIYLEERDEHDIVRNAMVGVFLRLLEYHQGVLFLTTNRVKNIDEAFYSRISVSIGYTLHEHDKRRKIWHNLLGAAKIEGLNEEVLAKEDLNGRQIKNCIRLGQVLARSANRPVDMAVMKEVIGLSTKFEHERRNPAHRPAF